jgi:colicin import membrane protein
MKVMLTFYARMKKKGKSESAADSARWEKIKWLGSQYFKDFEAEKKKKRKAVGEKVKRERLERLEEARRSRLADEAAKLAEQQQELADNIKRREEEVAKMVEDADRAEEAREQEAAEWARREADRLKEEEDAREWEAAEWARAPEPDRRERPYRDQSRFPKPTGALKQRQRRQARRREKKRKELPKRG